MEKKQNKNLFRAATGTGVAAVISLITMGFGSVLSLGILIISGIFLLLGARKLRTRICAYASAILLVLSFSALYLEVALKNPVVFWLTLASGFLSFLLFIESLRQESSTKVAGQFRVVQVALLAGLMSGAGFGFLGEYIPFVASVDMAIIAMVLGASGVLVSVLYLIRASFSLSKELRKPVLEQPKELGL